MARSVLSPYANDVIAQYRSGKTACKIAKDFGVSTTTATKFLIGAGVMEYSPRDGRNTLSAADARLAVCLFNKGISPSQILKQLPRKRSKSWLYSVFKEFNCDLQGWYGWKQTQENLEKQSMTKERTGFLTPAEDALFSMLSKEGRLDIIPQKSIGVHNADFLIASHSVAVELACRGSFMRYLRKGMCIDRIKEFGKAGWHTYVLFTKDREFLIRDGITDLLAWLDFIKRQPPTRRQYRVVRSPGDLLACGCSDDDKFPGIEPFIDSLK